MADNHAHSSLITTWSDGHAAWCEMLSRCERSLWLMDHDATGFHVDHGEGPDALYACLRRLNPGQVRILVRSETALLTRMPRTRLLLVDYGHIAQVRRIATHHARAQNHGIALGDERDVLLRPQLDAARALLRWDDPSDSARHLPLLLEMWDAAEPLSMGTVLGL